MLYPYYSRSHQIGVSLSPTTIGISIANSLSNAGLPTALSFFCAFALLISIELVLLTALVKLAKSTAEAALKTQFRKRYHIALSKSATIRPLLSTSEQGTVALHIPFWRYGNKDGSRDKRRQSNNLICEKSLLKISHFSIMSSEPFIIYWLYRELVLRGILFDRPKIFHGPHCAQNKRFKSAPYIKASLSSCVGCLRALFKPSDRFRRILR